MAVVTVCTTIPQDLWNLAREKHIPWNEALILGIKEMMKQPYKALKGEKIDEESVISKKIRQVNTMQNRIDEQNNEIEELKKKR